MIYEDPRTITRELARAALASNSPQEAAEALVSIALHEPDRRWAEHFLLQALEDPRRDVVAAAVTGLGHLARLHREVGQGVIPALRQVGNDVELAGVVEGALDDVRTFVGGSEV